MTPTEVNGIDKRLSSAHTPLWEVCIQWLKILGNKIDRKFSELEITSHPKYPSLVSVTDFLEMGHMDFNVLKVSAGERLKLNYPLLAHSSDNEGSLTVIVNPEELLFFDNANKWSGIVICPGANNRWNNRNNRKILNEKFVWNFSKIALGVFLSGMFLQCLYTLRQLTLVAFFILSLLGCFISIVLVLQKIVENFAFKNLFCSQEKTNACSSFSGMYLIKKNRISIADISALYFIQIVILCLFSPLMRELSSILSLLSFIGLLAASASLFTQGFLLKKWCTNCLALVTVLILQFLLARVWGFSHISLADVSISTILLTGNVGLFFIFRSLIQFKERYQDTLRQLYKWKRDPDVFTEDIISSPMVKFDDLEGKIILGNTEAEHTLSIFLGFYCGHCIKAFNLLLQEMKYRNEIFNLEVNFFVSDESDLQEQTRNTVIPVLKSLKSQSKIEEAITDWFKWMNLDKWKKNWGSSKPDNHGFTGRFGSDNLYVKKTPTVFLNGRQIPEKYNVEDFIDLMPQIFS